jgi:hypothetical protein
MTTPRRVGQSAPYVVVVGDALKSAHKTIPVANATAKKLGGRVGMVVHSGNCSTMHNLWSLTIGQRVTIDAHGRCLPCQP